MRRCCALAAVTAMSLAAACAWAQTPAKGVFKDKVKPGLYEEKNEADMGNMPGIPKEQKKQSTTRQRCLTPEEIDSLAEEKQPGCKTRNFKMAGNTSTFQVACGNDEMVSDVTMRFTPTGYTMQAKVALKPPAGGPTANVSQRVEARYLGPCPTKKLLGSDST